MNKLKRVKIVGRMEEGDTLVVLKSQLITLREDDTKGYLWPRGQESSLAGCSYYLSEDYDWHLVEDEQGKKVLLPLRRLEEE